MHDIIYAVVVFVGIVNDVVILNAQREACFFLMMMVFDDDDDILIALILPPRLTVR